MWPSLCPAITSVLIQGGGATATAGTAFSLTCTVTLAMAGPLNISWIDPMGTEVLSGSYQGTQPSLTLSTASIFFSKAGNYTCMATSGPHLSYAVAAVVVQSEFLTGCHGYDGSCDLVSHTQMPQPPWCPLHHQLRHQQEAVVLWCVW